MSRYESFLASIHVRTFRPSICSSCRRRFASSATRTVSATSCTVKAGTAKDSRRTAWVNPPARSAPGRRSVHAISEQVHVPGGSWPTIYALSTAAGTAAIAVIRISGPACKKIYGALCPDTKFPKPRYASLRSLYEPNARSDASKDKRSRLLDPHALVLFFPAPRSVTGEDVLELHIHGGIAVTKSVLAAIGSCSDTNHTVRYADPGEFTRRAFYHDRLDLPQIEALADTLNAATEEQRRIAVQGTTGGLAVLYERWRHLLIAARGELEALIDFSEDQHFDESPSDLAQSVARQIRALRRLIAQHCANAMRGELLRNGITLSFIGAPNAGKSSLLNQIVGRNAAIVSNEAGTTRDIVEVSLDLGGFFCRLGDTAGLRGKTSPLYAKSREKEDRVSEIEQEGIRRAKARALESDVIILTLSIEPSLDDQGVQLHLEEEVLQTACQLLDAGKTVIAVVNKIDRYEAAAESRIAALMPSLLALLPGLPEHLVFWTSCKSAAENTDYDTTTMDVGGITSLTDGLVRAFRDLTIAQGLHDPKDPAHIGGEFQSSDDGIVDTQMWNEALGATARQRTLLEECMMYLDAFLVRVSDANAPSQTQSNEDSDMGESVDIVAGAEDLRAAALCLARITGQSVEAGDVEQVLGVVFEK